MENQKRDIKKKKLCKTPHLSLIDNPFDILAEQAIKEYKAGKTISIEEYEKKHGL